MAQPPQRSRLGASLRHAWNAFVSDREDASFAQQNQYSRFYGGGGRNPGIVSMRHAKDTTVLTAIYVRLAIDAAGVDFRHVRLDDNEQYVDDIPSYLNDCLTVEANVDQASTAFFMDAYMSLFDDGYIALLPTDTTLNPDTGGGWDVQKMRVAEILEFFPQHVRLSAIDETDGQRKTLIVPKKSVAIIYNPFYSVMNDGASVLQRLVRKLAILDTLDEKAVNGKLDLLIQLPYTVRGKTKETQAEERRSFLESQIQNSPLGIGYIDANDKVIQLNRPVDNSLMAQVEYLVNLLYSQLGLSPEIMNGTVDEKTMLNYMNRTIEPLTKAVKQGMIRSFLTKTARTQGQSIMTFWDQWQFIPLSSMADLINSLSRNEILTANEIRPKIGYKPHDDPSADKLNNSNMPGGNAAAQDETAAPDGTDVVDDAPPVAPETPPAAPAAAPADPNQPLFDEMNNILDGAAHDLGVDI